MARLNHIPQFGNWDENDQMPYTTVFANARASKGGKITNPNDPLGNPEAFYGVEKNPQQSAAVNGDNPDEVMPKSHPQHQRRASRESVEFGQGREFSSTEDGGRRIYSRHERRPSRDDGVSNSRPASGDAARRGLPAMGNRDNGVYERVGGESPYRNPGPGYSPLHPQAHGRLGKKLGSASPAWERRSSDGGSGFAPGTPGRVRPEKGAPLPKFGEWDVNNPASGDGFTMIFDKARDERKAGGAVRIPALQAESPLQSGAEVDSHKFQAGPKESKPSGWLPCCFQPNAVQ